MTNLTERYEGYGGSIQKVMEQKDRNQGIIGVVADIIKVEKKYELPLRQLLVVISRILLRTMKRLPRK